MADLLKLIRDTVGSALPAAGLTLPATLIKTTEGAYAPGAASGDTAKTLVPYAAQGLISAYADTLVDGTLILRSDRRVTLFGTTISGGAVPVPGDSITIEGATYRIVPDGVKRDAAAATYVCQCRA